jgi:hypothetical protein|tara:strand:- start:1535 stop:1699 length:165 start_codon:yes stop_codon:yes gene_type:complete
MNDVLTDMQVLENAIIAFTEGASDEKRMAVDSLTRLLEDKQSIFAQFEAEESPN